LSFNPYKEGEDLKSQAQAYRRRYGCYPKVICADQIYRTRPNRAFCQRHSIRLSSSCLGRPKNDPELVAAEKQQFIDDQRQRNAVEGKIGQGKRRYGLGLIREKLAATQGESIAMNIMVMNLLNAGASFCLLYFLVTALGHLSWHPESPNESTALSLDWRVKITDHSAATRPIQVCGLGSGTAFLRKPNVT